MVKYTTNMMKTAKDLFPHASPLHELMRMGDTKALDLVQANLGLKIDEDDIVRAFRNKKENKILEAAKRVQKIRGLYCEMFYLIEKQHDKRAEVNQYEDCM